MPRGRVIPHGWAEHHRPVAKGTFTAYLRLHAPDAFSYNEAARMDTLAPGVVRWEGMGRVQQHNFESTYFVGESQVRSRAYLVSIDAEVNNAQVYDVIRAEAAGDGAMKELLVVSIEKGSERWQRDLICLDAQQPNLYKASL